MSSNELHLDRQRALSNPFVVVDCAFESSFNPSDPKAATLNIQEHFKQLFNSPEFLKQIPIFNALSSNIIPTFNNKLVRFKCMVQDNSCQAEVYPVVAKINDMNGNEKWICNKYRDDLPLSNDVDFDMREARDYFTEKQVFYGVSVPGESEWAQQAFYNLTNNFGSISLSPFNDTNNPLTAEYKCRKFPIPYTPHHSALVKIYDGLHDLKIGQVLDVVGILQIHDCLDTGDTDDDGIIELAPGVPRLHCIFFNQESNIVDLKVNQLVENSDEQLKVLQSSKSQIRSQLIEYIAQRFGGDTLAAEYVLMYLIGRIHTRFQQVVHLGSISLNLSKCPSPYPSASESSIDTEPQFNLSTFGSIISGILSKLTPKSAAIPLSLPVMNNTFFMPHSSDLQFREAQNMNEGHERKYSLRDIGLESGLLQLTDHTNVLVDETVLKEGKLGALGINNLRTLTTLSQSQTLRYALSYADIEMPVDLPLLVLSESKSLLSTDIVLPLDSQLQISRMMHGEEQRERHLDGNENLQMFRLFILTAKMSTCDLNEEATEVIQSHWVNSRQDAQANNQPLPTQEDLSTLVLLARLYTLSHQLTTLTPVLWTQLLDLERQRKERLRKVEVENQLIKAVNGLNVAENEMNQ